MSAGSEANNSATGRAASTLSHNPLENQAQHDSEVEASAGRNTSTARADPEREEGDRAGSEEDGGNQGNTMQHSLRWPVCSVSCRISCKPVDFADLAADFTSTHMLNTGAQLLSPTLYE